MQWVSSAQQQVPVVPELVHQVLWGYGERKIHTNTAKREPRKGGYEDSFTFHQFCIFCWDHPSCLPQCDECDAPEAGAGFLLVTDEGSRQSGAPAAKETGGCICKTPFGGKKEGARAGAGCSEIHLRTTATQKSLPTPVVVWKPLNTCTPLLLHTLSRSQQQPSEPERPQLAGSSSFSGPSGASASHTGLGCALFCPRSSSLP